jgi:hypothetical protein
MKYRRLATLAVLSAASAGFSAPVFSAPPPAGAYLREDGNYWMHGPQFDYIVGPASAYSAPGTHGRRAPPASRREAFPGERGSADRDARHRDHDRDGHDRDRDRDRDHDGVRDRHDRDRDNDGVPNRQDSRPDNPRRH